MKFLLSLITTGVMLLLVGCNETTSSMNNVDSGTSNASKAMLSVMLTDAPSDDVEAVISTINKIEFVGDDHSVTVFDGSATVNLMELSSIYELLTINSVEPGDYDRVRIKFGDVTLVTEDSEGDTEETSVSLVSASTEVLIDHGLLIEGGEVLSLKIDFDIDKTLAMMQEVNGELVIKPVLFVDIERDLLRNKVTRIHGRVDVIDNDGYRLCDIQLVSAAASDVRHFNACIDVDLDNETTFFGEQGLPINQHMVELGDAVTTVGFLDHRIAALPAIPPGHLPPPGACRIWHLNLPPGLQPPPEHCAELAGEETPPNTVLVDDQGVPIDDVFGLDALVVEVGELGTYQRLRGEAVTSVVNQQFELDVEHGLETENSLLAQLFNETRIFSTDGIERDPTVIQPGTQLELDGVLVLSNSEPDVIRAAFIQVSLDEILEMKLSGTVLIVDDSDQSLSLSTDTGDRCVNAEKADIFEVIVDEGQLVTRKIALSELEPDQAIDVFGFEDIDGCFNADTIIAEG